MLCYLQARFWLPQPCESRIRYWAEERHQCHFCMVGTCYSAIWSGDVPHRRPEHAHSHAIWAYRSNRDSFMIPSAVCFASGGVMAMIRSGYGTPC